jgi:hypothetical protein
MSIPENLPWIPADALGNVMLCTFFYAPAFAIGCLLAAAWPPRSFFAFFGRAGKLLIFVGSLLLSGAVFSCVWGVTIWGWLYRSTDYCGNDFFPFVPIGQAALDVPFGNEPHGLLHGSTLLQLRLVWLAFAICTWVTTLLLYRLLSRSRRRKRALIPEYKALMAKAPNGDSLDDLNAVRGDR